jgi:predicted GNAT family N-acyltransferase
MDIQLFNWGQAEDLALPVRLQVFVKEQGVPLDLEVDEYDPIAKHAVIFDDGVPIGTGRVFKKNPNSETFFIGRLCILKKYRDMGYGQELMATLIKHARQQSAQTCCLHAQTISQFFYKKFGFIATGDTFMEAGIEHIQMQLTVS